MSKKKSKRNNHTDPSPSSDGSFAFIAGYTPAGFPYGTTWEEIGIDPSLPFSDKIYLYESGEYAMPTLDTGFTPEEEQQLNDLRKRLVALREEFEIFAVETGDDLVFEGIEDLDSAIMYMDMAAGVDVDEDDDIIVHTDLKTDDDDDSELPF